MMKKQRLTVPFLAFSLTLCGIVILGLVKTLHLSHKPSLTNGLRFTINRRQRFVRTSPAEVRKQRNKLSALMNSMKLNFAKMACEIEELRSKLGKKAPDEMSICKRPTESHGKGLPFDKTFADKLGALWANQSVAILGDATGSYKRYLGSEPRLHICDSYDDDPYVMEISHGFVQYLDMSTPQYGLPIYDWIMSWQMTEHVPAEFVDVFVDNLARHGGTGLVLIWDDITSAGDTKTRVHGDLGLKGLVLDELKTKEIRDSASNEIVKQNVIVYKRTHRLPSPLDA